MKVTLQLNDGREMTFSEVKNISVLEEHFKNQESDVKQEANQTAQEPIEGKPFRVDPSNIDQKLFAEKRSDSKQEELRKLILEAFEKVRNSPELNRVFYTLIMEKKWVGRKNAYALRETARSWGDHMAYWYEWALMLAQRIANGESFEKLCNEEDGTTQNALLVEWKNNHARIVGGGITWTGKIMSAFNVGRDAEGDWGFFDLVPLIVLYKVDDQLTV